MSKSTLRIATFLFFSGMCALIYQTAWLREFKLLFGASTAASAAVLAIFVGGLGAGGWWLGRRADQSPRPLLMYAHLEVAIALFAVVTPLLLKLARWVYVAMGGSVGLGPIFATVVRLLLAALVLAPAVLLMGGTLPAAARAAETDQDASRRSIGILYGLNTLGAVAGCLLSTFLLLERLGTRQTLWVAALVNLLVATFARVFSRTLPTVAVGAAPDARQAPPEPPQVPAPFVLGAAALVGFAFFLMEMVWFRMLGPLLGGTVFTFGLILAVALLGIALGGAAYGVFSRERPATAAAFIATTLLEAFFVAVPLALGNRLSVLTIYLQPLRGLGFGPQLFGWLVISLITVFPAALVSGYQFPLLIALLGKGRTEVGRQVGLAYAWNTVGAIAGSLGGGFGLLPALTAPGCWRLTVGLLVALSLATAVVAPLRRSPLTWLLSGAGSAVVLALILFAQGPTAAWRHVAIGIGRVPSEMVATPQRVIAFTRSADRGTFWQAEGVESAVALDKRPGLALIVNGKSDGSAINDAPTMVMSALLAPLLHPSLKRGMVIGLGTGTTAGWLAALPQMERVDVVELEPAVVQAAEYFKPVSRDALHQPKVHLFTGDAREVLLSTPERYDFVFSEPSNPYRAGVASLFTQEYYRAIRARLNADGVFCQWVQAYEVDRDTIRTLYATVSSVFPHVETWQVHTADILLVASEKPVPIDVAQLRQRLTQNVFREGLRATWRATDAEGVLARYVGGQRTAELIAQSAEGALNTDDQTLVEFAFARALSDSTFTLEEIREVARALGDDRPSIVDGAVDWEHLEQERGSIYASLGFAPLVSPRLPPVVRESLTPTLLYLQGKPADALQAWEARGYQPRTSTERLLMSEALAEKGDEHALPLIDAVRLEQPIEANMLLARLKLRQGHVPEAAELLRSAFVRYRNEPWVSLPVVKGALSLAEQIAHKGPTWTAIMLSALREPFVVYSQDERRLELVLEMAEALPPDRSCVDLFEALEPNAPWNLPDLRFRARCYRGFNAPRADLAERELLDYNAAVPKDLVTQFSSAP